MITKIGLDSNTINAGNADSTVAISSIETVVVTCGLVGEAGQNGAMSEPEIVSIIHNTIHANSTRDAIIIKPDGNIKISIRSLLPLP